MAQIDGLTVIITRDELARYVQSLVFARADVRTRILSGTEMRKFLGSLIGDTDHLRIPCNLSWDGSYEPSYHWYCQSGGPDPRFYWYSNLNTEIYRYINSKRPRPTWIDKHTRARPFVKMGSA